MNKLLTKQTNAKVLHTTCCGQITKLKQSKKISKNDVVQTHVGKCYQCKRNAYPSRFTWNNFRVTIDCKKEASKIVMSVFGDDLPLVRLQIDPNVKWMNAHRIIPAICFLPKNVMVFLRKFRCNSGTTNKRHAWKHKLIQVENSWPVAFWPSVSALRPTTNTHIRRTTGMADGLKISCRLLWAPKSRCCISCWPFHSFWLPCPCGFWSCWGKIYLKGWGQQLLKNGYCNQREPIWSRHKSTQLAKIFPSNSRVCTKTLA